MSDDYLSPRRMLGELALPIGSGDRYAILEAFADSLDPLVALLHCARVDKTLTRGERTFGIIHLLTRSISDLLAGGHLASHCYLPQAYSVMRPVLDSCDLIELFAQDEQQAILWANTTEGHKDFAPADVRELIGEERFSPVHSHYSESGSHPRFAGAQISGAFQIDVEDPENKMAVMRLGPMFLEHPSTLLVWLFAFDAVIRVGFKVRHLEMVTDGSVTRVKWMRAYLESVDACMRGSELVRNALGEEPSEDSPIQGWRALRDQLKIWIEEES